MKKVIEQGSWKKHFDYRFLSGEDILEMGKELVVTIKSVGMDEVFNGKVKEEVMVVSFNEGQKMIVLNKTNAKMISKIAGSQKVENWIGVQVALISERVSAFGGQHDAVRVKRVKKDLNIKIND